VRRLGFALALLFAACSSRPYAEERRALVEVRMTADVVRARIGNPGRVIRVATSSAAADQTTEVWECGIDAPPTAGELPALARAAGALVLVVAARGGGSMGGGSGSPRYRFWVGFGADRRVRGVTHLEGVK
jgi:hypothetical protein